MTIIAQVFMKNFDEKKLQTYNNTNGYFSKA